MARKKMTKIEKAFWKKVRSYYKDEIFKESVEYQEKNDLALDRNLERISKTKIITAITRYMYYL